MNKSLVTISFKQIIDASKQGWFERGVINASYDEFLLKSQAYNPELKYNTFLEMVANNGKANSLHYKCGFPVIPYINLLKNEIPGLTDNNNIPIKFVNHQVHLINSDINNKLAHKVSITYFTETLSLLHNFGEYLLLAYGNKFSEDTASSKPIEDTFLLKICPLMSFVSYQEI